jgi:hypothetical protein
MRRSDGFDFWRSTGWACQGQVRIAEDVVADQVLTVSAIASSAVRCAADISDRRGTSRSLFSETSVCE